MPKKEKPAFRALRPGAFLLALLALAALLAAAAGGTVAYFSARGQVRNTLAVGSVRIALDEPHYPAPEPQNLTPGTSYPKDPTVTNAYNDAYMRIKLTFVDMATELPITSQARVDLIWRTLYYSGGGTAAWFHGLGAGAGTPAGAQYSSAELAGATHINSAVFAKDAARSTAGTGVEYYNYTGGTGGIFAKNAVAVLFDSVVIPADWGADELAALGSYRVVVEAQAIQTKGFANAAAALTALHAACGGV